MEEETVTTTTTTGTTLRLTWFGLQGWAWVTEEGFVGRQFRTKTEALASQGL